MRFINIKGLVKVMDKSFMIYSLSFILLAYTRPIVSNKDMYNLSISYTVGISTIFFVFINIFIYLPLSCIFLLNIYKSISPISIYIYSLLRMYNEYLSIYIHSSIYPSIYHVCVIVRVFLAEGSAHAPPARHSHRPRPNLP